MRSMRLIGKTGADGVLHLSIPLSAPDAAFDVVVVVKQQTAAIHPDWPPGFFEQTAGAWQGELGRAPQRVHQERDEF